LRGQLPRSLYERVPVGRDGQCSVRSHASDIALRWSAEQAAVLATELRGTFITHESPGVIGIEVLIEHQLPCLLQPQLLLELQGAGTCDRAEMLPEGGWTHMRAVGEFVHA
jgi:hypothetical protein